VYKGDPSWTQACEQNIQSHDSEPWNELTYQRQFLENLAEHLQISSPEQWQNKISSRLIADFGGSELLSRYTSLNRLLSTGIE
jgi:hypothetical protein